MGKNSRDTRLTLLLLLSWIMSPNYHTIPIAAWVWNFWRIFGHDFETITSTYNEYKTFVSIGALDRKSYLSMDLELQAMIAGISKALSDLTREELSWKRIRDLCRESDFLEPMQEEVIRWDVLYNKTHSLFRFDSTPDPIMIRQVEIWFNKLVSDGDILENTNINIREIAEVFAWTGARVDNILHLIYRRERNQRVEVDVGIIRYPIPIDPYFKLYRIKIEVRSDCKRFLFYQVDNNFIVGEFAMQKFRPKSHILEKFQEPILQSYVQEAMMIFR